ncbi:ABC transporter substrate-binding protein [Chelatococcus sp. GCM10030263]|uniref:ABC transporter substrate-binding protein n=1 Tax=Chelatococcus sp. GCM10030263 TaxID=3273387 RepID=UPI00360DAB31
MTELSRRTLLAAGVGTAVLGAAPRSFAQQRRTITIASQALPPTMEPMDTPGTSSVWYRTQYNVFEGLLGLDFKNNMRVRGALAERWSQVDARTWEFTLRSGVKFHDGRELSADDVLVSLGDERLMGENAPGRAAARGFLPTFERAEKVDDRTVRLITNTNDPAFDRRIAAWGGQIISGAAFRAAPNWQAWAMAPVGTGPYRVSEIRRDYGISLSPHDAYWGGRPPLGGIHFRAVPEAAGRIAGLLAGDWDIATDVTPDAISEIESNPGFKVVEAGSNVTRMVVLDVKHNPQLRDVNLRRALSLAVDRQLLVDSLWLGRTTIPNGFQSPAFGPLYDPDRPGPAYDPDRARELLKASSYRGEKITFRTTGTYYLVERQTTEALVEMWRAVGINVAVEFVENYAQWYRRPGAGMYNYSSVMLYPDPLSDLVRNFGPTGAVQRIEDSWSNEEFNALSRAIGNSGEVNERRRMLGRMLDILEWDDPPMVLLFKQNMFYGVRADLDWKPYPAHQMDFGPGNLGAI